MKYTDAIKLLEEDKLSGVVFIYGEEAYLIDYLINIMKNTYLNEATSLLNYEKIDMERPDISRIEEACETLPFMAEKRIVEVRGLDLSREGQSKFKDFYKDLAEYLARISRDTILIIISSSQKFFKGKLYKEAEKSSHIINIARLKRSELANFIGKRLASEGIKISKSTMVGLLDILSYDNEDLGLSLYDVNNEIEKLIARTTDRVSREELSLIHESSKIGNIFALTDSICNFRPDEAIKNFLILNEAGDNYQVFYMIQRQFRNLFYIKTLEEASYNRSQIGAIVGLKNYEFNKLMGFVRSYTLASLGACMEEIYETDLRLKSSKGDYETNLLNLITRLSQRPHGA